VTDEEIARVVHAANMEIQRIQGDLNPSQLWDHESPEIKESAIEGVRQARLLAPEELHEDWVKNKQAHGWVYGEYKDTELKTHPCMVPWEQLPEDQRVKDRLFIAIVHALSDDDQ
jgi:RyR domain